MQHDKDTGLARARLTARAKKRSRCANRLPWARSEERDALVRPTDMTLAHTGQLACLGVLALAAVACGPGFGDVARARGATDLDCPVEHVSAYRAHGGLYVARGCERWAEYACVASAGGPVCVPDTAPKVSPEPGS